MGSEMCIRDSKGWGAEGDAEGEETTRGEASDGAARERGEISVA